MLGFVSWHLPAAKFAVHLYLFAITKHKKTKMKEWVDRQTRIRIWFANQPINVTGQI